MISKIKAWVVSIIHETKAITWPSRKRIINDTSIVLVSLVVGTGILAAIDYGFLELFKAALNKIG
jgi:preprotein translocase SecE subunit